MNNRDFVISVRKKPVNSDDDVITTTSTTVSIRESKQKVNLEEYESTRTFDFDYVFSDRTNNLAIYRTLLSKKVAKLKNIICYTFGETGSGKTHTLFGKNLCITREFGLIETCMYDLLKTTQSAEITAFEIYNNKIYDLIDTKHSMGEIYEKAGEIHIVGLETFNCNIDNVKTFIDKIIANRTVGISSENSRSSRSHVIIKIISNTTNLIFVDVAGCERGQSDQIAQTAMNEMININKDNFALKECMRSVRNSQHNRIPFRLSRITMVLKESFFNNYDTIIIATINPKKSNTSTTLNILSYLNDFKLYTKLPKLVKQLERPATSPKIKSNKKEKISKLPPIKTNKKIINKLLKLSTDEKSIYSTYLNQKNTIKSLPELFGPKIQNLKADQLNLLKQLGIHIK